MATIVLYYQYKLTIITTTVLMLINIYLEFEVNPKKEATTQLIGSGLL